MYITHFTINKKSLKKGIVSLALGLGLLGASQVAQADTVKVSSGDTISQIAQEHNDTVSHIEKVNHLKDVSLIFPGDKIVTGDTKPAKRDIKAQNTPQESTQAPVQQSKPTQVQTPAPAPKVAQKANNGVSQGISNNIGSAGEEIARGESGGDYNARNGRFVGKFQLDAQYLNGDYSPANQDRTFLKYCNDRYGSVEAALAFRQSHGWY